MAIISIKHLVEDSKIMLFCIVYIFKCHFYILVLSLKFVLVISCLIYYFQYHTN